MNLRATFFGKFLLRHGDSVIENIKSQKSLELFAYLLLRRQAHSRESVADLIWGDHASTEQSRKYLRNTLWQLQKHLAPQIPDDLTILEADARTITVNPAISVSTDVEEFESAFDEVRDVDGALLTKEQASNLRRALDMYSGPFLGGWFSDWCLVQRERSQHMVLLVLDKLMAYAASQGEYESGIFYGERILQFDRAREVTHRNLMMLFYLAGDRSSAVRQYQLCESILKEELDISPSERTRTVLESIRNETLEKDAAKEELRK
ncbi:MAG: bacterial transcriptional activator domain-containing protein [Rhodothermales bacterium]